MIGRADLQALPDALEPPVVLPAWFLPGAHLVLPHALALGEDVRLELARGVEAGTGSAAHGRLDLRLDVPCHLDLALERVRATDPTATVRAAAPEHAWLWLGVGEQPLEGPVRLGGVGVGTRRRTWRLDADQAVRLRRLLDGGTLLLQAVVHAEVPAVAPRRPLRVRFDRAATVAALGPERSWSALLGLVRTDPAALGLELLGDADGAELALACLLRTEVGAAAPGSPDAGPSVSFPDGATGTVDADLRLPLPTWLPLALALPPTAPVRAEVVETRLPTLRTGVHVVEVAANVPSGRTGVLALGAQLTVPPAPPDRPVAAVAGVELLEPTDCASATLVLDPGEPLRFAVQATAVVHVGAQVVPLAGPAATYGTTHVRLDEDAFPVRFHTVEATPSVLALARVDGVLRARWHDAPYVLPFAVGPTPVTLAVPHDLDGPLLQLLVRPLDGDGPSLPFEPQPPGDLRLELHSLPGWGPQRMRVAGSGTVEVAPEADLTRVQALVLTPEGTVVTWFADSPFRPGLVHRRRPSDPWSSPVVGRELLLVDVPVPA